ncbi:ankyrin repeat-containing domain protein [Morchella snyderi]|nr:ankyrin repeat-containing domain protein [Morchella snyderi]
MHTKSRQVSRTALHWASARGRKTFVVRLLVLGAKVHVNTKDEEGMTPLHSATIFGHGDLVKLLLENGADMEAKNQEGWTPLLCVSITGGHQLARLEKGADIASSGQKYLGWTALHYAAALGRFQVVDLLIKMGSRIGATDILRNPQCCGSRGEKNSSAVVEPCRV